MAEPRKPGARDGGRVRELFATLRDDAAKPPAGSKPPDPPEASDEGSDGAEPRPTEPSTTAEADPDAALRAARDELLDRLVERVMRPAKRLLQDEQNDVLDASRRVRQRLEASKLLPDAEASNAAWTALLAPALDEAYDAGRRLAGKTRHGSAPPRVAARLSASATAPLNDRVLATIEAVVSEGPYESKIELQRALATAIAARYREWRTRDLEPHLGDLLAGAYARGAYDAAPSGARLRWVPAELGQCPDADDNALEPTVKGQSFPTGQSCPPAHPGCRCLAVPADTPVAD